MSGDSEKLKKFNMLFVPQSKDLGHLWICYGHQGSVSESRVICPYVAWAIYKMRCTISFNFKCMLPTAHEVHAPNVWANPPELCDPSLTAHFPDLEETGIYTGGSN